MKMPQLIRGLFAITLTFLGALILLMAAPAFNAPTEAAPSAYDKNTILCDHDFEFTSSLAQAEIQAIFDARNSFFKNYMDPTTNHLASWVIADRAQHYQISSRVLLAKMQAESSSVWAYKDMNQHIYNAAGIDMGTRADWVLFYGWSDTVIYPQYKGFYNQVDNAAKSLSEWFTNPGSKGWTVGQPHPVSDGTVTPTNRATAALYIYTPWISSNNLLYQVWEMMFGNTGACQALDLAFVIDTTGSMWDDIAAAKSAATDIVDSVMDAVPDSRIAVVDFRDFPVYPYGQPGLDYDYHDALPFTSDRSAAINAINGLTLGNGMDWPEDDYCALMHAINGHTCRGSGVGSGIGDWRSIPAKFIILMTDAPPHDPEPFTDFTWSDVAQAAWNADPITIEVVAIGGADPRLAQLAAETGGDVFTAPTADDVVDAIMEAIETILESPIADAGGPYNGTVGSPITFDASGSYDPDGTIVSYEWDWDDDGAYDETTASPTIDHTYVAPFLGQVRLRVTDDDGLTGIGIAAVTVEEPADSTPPTTTISLSPASPDGDNNWYVSPVTVTLSAEDDPGGSGVASTEYRLDGGPWQPYAGPFTLSTGGTTAIDARSTDNAANVEDPPASATVQIDQTSPSVTIDVPADGVAVQDGVTLAASASDATSGVSDVRLYVQEDDGDSGIDVGFEDLPATYNPGTGHWEYWIDTTLLPDGYYVALAKAEDNAGIGAWSEIRHFSIRNWAVLELLPASESNKAGRTMPVKFSLRMAATVDPVQPFVYNEDLTIKIYETGHPGDVLQTSTYGDTARDYRIDQVGELYITNFKTLRQPKDYTVDIWRHNTIAYLVGSFGFATVK